jgi:pantetheine-phosphate adenylyltransferase
MSKAICPGTFDPVTNGHLDIIERAARVFEHVFVVVFRNPAKSPMFGVDERMEMLREAAGHLPNVTVDSSDGLLVEYAKAVGAQVIVKGLRAVTDFEYEFQMALMNRKLSTDIETVFLPTAVDYGYLSSNMVKMLAGFGASTNGLVPPGVQRRLADRTAAGK